MRNSSKRLQRSPAAACSCSQLGSTRTCWTDFCATNSLVRTIPASVPLSGSPPTRGRPRLGCGASAHLEAGGCPIPVSSRWVLTSSTRGIASACPYLACPLTDNAQGSHRRGLGTAWAAPDAFSKSVAGVRSSEPREQECSAGLEESFVAYAPCRDAQRPGTGHTAHVSMACRAMLASGKASTNRHPFQSGR